MALKDENDGTTVLDDNECVIAVLLTNHLLSPLIPGHQYVINDKYQDKPTYCPCYQSKSCRIKINYDRTSIGKINLYVIVRLLYMFMFNVYQLPVCRDIEFFTSI